MRAPSRNKALEAHQRQFTNKPIGSQQLVGINPPKKKFPRHGRWRPPVKRTYYRQANNGFMVMGQPAPQPQLGIEAITKIIAGIQMREPLRANAIQNIPTVNQTAKIERNFEQMFSAINELRDSQDKALSRDEIAYPAFSVGTSSESFSPGSYRIDDESLTGSGSPLPSISSQSQAPSIGEASAGESDDIGYGDGVRPDRDQDRADTVSNPGTISSDGSLLRDLEDYESDEMFSAKSGRTEDLKSV